MMYATRDFDYPLPEASIAQAPVTPRDRARLLVSRAAGVEDRVFAEVAELLEAGDLLVLNDTRVIPARLFGEKPTGGRVECLLLRPLEGERVWEAWLRASKPLREGGRVRVDEGFSLLVRGRVGDGYRVELATAGEAVEAALARVGRLPLPPYIRETDAARDRERYQTVFAAHPGAVAAPTAGLHFTEALLARLRDKGVGIAFVTLHVGPGTFQPIREEDPARHVMHREWCCLAPETAQRVNDTRARGGQVVAVGSTAARTLESAARAPGRVDPFQGETALFIRPGFRFQAVTRLITNFHLPRSTLLMLVAAFVGKGRLDRDYGHALASGYRFYSYGDATFLFPEHEALA